MSKTIENGDSLQVLAKNIVGNTALVKNFDQAYDIAKEHKVNCITLEREIVYAEGFLTRVGNNLA